MFEFSFAPFQSQCRSISLDDAKAMVLESALPEESRARQFIEDVDDEKRSSWTTLKQEFVKRFPKRINADALDEALKKFETAY